MNNQDSLRPITRRAIPLLYISPLVCRLAVPFSASVVAGTTSEVEINPVLRKAGPSFLTVTVSGGDDIVLTWESLYYALGYVVYRSTTGPAGPFVLEASNVLFTTYTDENLSPGTYHYRVTALEEDFGETFPSPTEGAIVV